MDWPNSIRNILKRPRNHRFIYGFDLTNKLDTFSMSRFLQKGVGKEDERVL